MNVPYQRKLAHLATVPGGSRQGENVFRRSRRQRRKAFEVELKALVINAARKYGVQTSDDMPWEAMVELNQAAEAARLKWLLG
jgi:hypothetical protein